MAGLLGGVQDLLGMGPQDINAPTIDTRAGTQAIMARQRMAQQAAQSQGYSLAATARGSSSPLALREAQRRGALAQQQIGQQGMAEQAQLEQNVAAQNAQMNLQAQMANAQAQQQANAATLGAIGTIGAGALMASDIGSKRDIFLEPSIAASDERAKQDIARLDAQVNRDISKMGGPPATAGVLPPPSPFEGESVRPDTARAPIAAAPDRAYSGMATPDFTMGPASVRPAGARLRGIDMSGAQAPAGLTGTNYGLTKTDVADTFAQMDQANEAKNRALAADAYQKGPSAIQTLGITPEDAQAAYAQQQAGLPVQRPVPYVPGGAAPASAADISTTSWDAANPRQRWQALLDAKALGNGIAMSDEHSKEEIQRLRDENHAFRKYAGFAWGAVAPGGLLMPEATLHGKRALDEYAAPPEMGRAVAAGQPTVAPAFVPKNEAEAARYGTDWMRRNREDAARDAAARDAYLADATRAEAARDQEQTRYAMSDTRSKSQIQALEDMVRGYEAELGKRAEYPTPRAYGAPPTARFPDVQAEHPLVATAADTPTYSWRYKPEYAAQSNLQRGLPPTAPEGYQRRVSPMAQDLERNPVTAPAVQTGPDGMKRVDTGQLTMSNSAILSDLARMAEEQDARIRQIEARRSSVRYPKPRPMP